MPALSQKRLFQLASLTALGGWSAVRGEAKADCSSARRPTRESFFIGFVGHYTTAAPPAHTRE